jgi:hypothetical protein
LALLVLVCVVHGWICFVVVRDCSVSARDTMATGDKRQTHSGQRIHQIIRHYFSSSLFLHLLSAAATAQLPQTEDNNNDASKQLIVSIDGQRGGSAAAAARVTRTTARTSSKLMKPSLPILRDRGAAGPFC